MTLNKLIATAAAACMLMVAPAAFATPTGGTTLAGAHNGMGARTRMHHRSMKHRSMMHHMTTKKAM